VADSFLFELSVSDEPRFDALLYDLASCVLEQVGYAPAAIAQILAQLRDAIEREGVRSPRKCDVQFRSQGGELHIVVSYGGGRECRVAHALPD
jgi:hypothetical protein